MVPVLDLPAGSAVERGLRYGATMRARIERSLANYAQLFALSGIAWKEACRRAAALTDAIGNFAPGLLDELAGVARGAGRAMEELLALNARTEILSGGPLAAAPGECTAVAVAPWASATGGTLLAQNWDWFSAQRDALVLLRVRKDSGPGFLTLAEAGMLAKIGLNAAGLGICLNILHSSDDGERPGVPVHIFLRALLDEDSVASAVEAARRATFSASSNVLCADAAGALVALELCPRGVRIVREDGRTLCHTNHFLDEEAGRRETPLAVDLSSRARLARARQILANSARIGVEDIARLLWDRSDGPLSICRVPDTSMPELECVETVASVLMELETRVLRLTLDPRAKRWSQTVFVDSEGGGEERRSARTSKLAPDRQTGRKRANARVGRSPRARGRLPAPKKRPPE